MKHSIQTAAFGVVYTATCPDCGHTVRSGHATEATVGEVADIVAAPQPHEDEEAEARVAWCPTCRFEVESCDEDRACLCCGTDLIILADRLSAELLADLQASTVPIEQIVTLLEDRARYFAAGTGGRPLEVDLEVAREFVVVVAGLGAGATDLAELNRRCGLASAEANQRAHAERELTAGPPTPFDCAQ